MGLTKEQLHKKREDEIIKYVEDHGTKISETMTYWGTYPVCVKDICVLGVMVKGKKTKKVLFGDLKDKKFTERKSAEIVEHLVLSEVLDDMRIADGYAARKEEREAAKAAKAEKKASSTAVKKTVKKSASTTKTKKTMKAKAK